MVDFITENGISVDLKPDQEIALTIENAFLSDDHIPVAWTTDVELPNSEKNRLLFRLPGAMLLPAQTKEINVEMRIDAIPVMSGKLKLQGTTKNTLNASFAGVAIEDALTGSLPDAPFTKWNFGRLGPLDDRTLYDAVMTSAGANTREDFATPLMIRDSQLDQPDNYVSTTGIYPAEFLATKFLNHKQGNFMLPVVKLKYILQTVFAGCQIDPAYSKYLDGLGIVAPYRKNGSLDNLDIGCLDKDDNGNFILDLAQAMPDVTVEEFIKNFLVAFCATIFVTVAGKTMKSNISIIEDSEFTDWSSRVNENIEQELEPGQSYEFGFSGVSDTKIAEPIVTLPTIRACIDTDEGTVAFCEESGDIYRRIARSFLFSQPHTGSETIELAGLNILQQKSMYHEQPANKSQDAFSAVSSFVPVKSLPYTLFTLSEGGGKNSMTVMAPVVEVPTVGGSRSDTIQFGTLMPANTNALTNNVQMTSNGCYCVIDRMGWDFQSDKALALGGTEGIYERFHKAFETWLSKDKTVTKVVVDLTAADIANLRIWQKVMLYNQLFFIKTLTVTFNSSRDFIYTEAELVTA